MARLDSPDTDERILRATLELIREGGARAATTDAVARRAGTSKATIYRRWRSRSELLAAASGSVVKLIEVPDLGSLIKEARYLLEARLEQFQDEFSGSTIAALVGSADEDQLTSNVLAGWTSSQKTSVQELVQRSIDRHELDDSWSAHDLATVVGGAMLTRLVIERQIPDQNLVDTILEILRACIGASEKELFGIERARPV
ncbi:TetR/AcrR family transcriptional regulator [Tomitella cavernea]|uniref:TetR/AcrR family transcriptional regulator n=1 Tax=Tomitella cavernea TaxID=1387982 RepID=A0ABP9C0Q4_9ACTN|nr:TetR/AcrR family transcriptional regulator [Tomitella cavernea]